MSRLIKKSIAIPEKTTAMMNGDFLAVKGDKGELQVTIPSGVEIAIEGKEVWIKNAKGPSAGALLGTTWALTRNAIQGVSEGFVKVLEIEGVGYRAALEGKEL